MSDDYDILIKNAIVVDGTGSPAFKGEVAVLGERIASIGEIDLGKAEKVIDAGGKIVSPGFIDVHNHGDLSIIYCPTADGFIRQGITTFVGGNCGSSPAPFNDFVSFPMFLNDIHKDLCNDMYYPEPLLSRDLFNERHKELFGWEIEWRTMGEFLKKVEDGGISPNFVPLLGHGPIRYSVLGHDFRRNALPEEIESMQVLVQEAMMEGCKGFSVGRDYEPSYYANFDELVSLTSIVSKYEGVYTSHCLRTGLRKARRPGEFPPVKIKGLLEAIDVGRKTKISVQISHLGPLYDVNPGGNRSLMEASINATLKIVDDAWEEGIDVSFDTIPGYRGFGTRTSVWLAGILLPWLKITGSREQLGKSLMLKQFREEVKESLWAGKWYSLNPNINPQWAKRHIIMENKEKQFLNKTVADIAEETGVDPIEALMDILVADPDTKVGSMGRDDWAKMLFYKHSQIMLGVDTFAIDVTWETKHPPWNKPSENSFGGFPVFFKRAVRETRTLSIEEAVRKVSSLPAAKFKLKDRGVLKPGAHADIVIMDLEKITDKAEPLNPCVYPFGIEYVIVNGSVVVEKSVHKGIKSGKILYNK
jgi:N-acyl-D-aspartate/D-glutamate deacylase